MLFEEALDEVVLVTEVSRGLRTLQNVDRTHRKGKEPVYGLVQQPLLTISRRLAIAVLMVHAISIARKKQLIFP